MKHRKTEFISCGFAHEQLPGENPNFIPEVTLKKVQACLLRRDGNNLLCAHDDLPFLEADSETWTNTIFHELLSRARESWREDLALQIESLRSMKHMVDNYVRSSYTLFHFSSLDEDIPEMFEKDSEIQRNLWEMIDILELCRILGTGDEVIGVPLNAWQRNRFSSLASRIQKKLQGYYEPILEELDRLEAQQVREQLWAE